MSRTSLKSSRLNIPVDERQLDEWKRAARAEDRSLSSWARRALDEKAGAKASYSISTAKAAK